jgi:hypothetical protein
MGQQNQQRGPAAKNYKVWKSCNTSKLFAVTSYQTLRGPQAKNFKPWENEVNYSPIVQAERAQLLGPKAKNSHRFVYREYNDVQLGSAKEY